MIVKNSISALYDIGKKYIFAAKIVIQDNMFNFKSK